MIHGESVAFTLLAARNPIFRFPCRRRETCLPIIDKSVQTISVTLLFRMPSRPYNCSFQDGTKVRSISYLPVTHLTAQRKKTCCLFLPVGQSEQSQQRNVLPKN